MFRLLKNTLLLFFCILLFNCEQELLPPQTSIQKLDKVKMSSLGKEPYLGEILDKLKFIGNSTARTNGSGNTIDTDSILMVLQADSLSYSYTFRVVNKTTDSSFTNLVFKKVNGGFNAFYLTYQFEENLSPDFENFTGKVTSYNLDNSEILTQYFKNGNPINKSTSGGKVQCTQTISVEKHCLGPDNLNLTVNGDCYYGWETVISISYSGSCYSDSNGSSNSGGGGLPSQYTSYTWSNGTFVPFSFWSDGGMPGGPGQPSQTTNPCTAADGGAGLETGTDPNSCSDIIGIIPPTDEEIRLMKLALLKNLLQENPFYLVEIPCDELPKWQVLAQHVPPQSVIDKLKNLDDNYTSIISGDWDIQYIENASGPIVNMDYFPVTISKLPKDPATGLQFTPDGFFNYVRKNLNSFFEGNDTEFGPYNSDEATIWTSTNYLGAIMRFDINGPFGSTQDGSVICSFQNDNVWRFTTIESPEDWSHPVSGTREFGLTTNADGTYTFYTRGVDRVAESTDDFIGGLPSIQSALDGGDALWTKFQENLESYIEKPQNAGLALIQTPVVSRPDWEKVKAVLRGDRPISDLGCD
jgi:hypothetical protein